MFQKISKATRDKLAKLGIRSPFDLLLHLPLRYQDETHLYPIADAPLSQAVLVEGVVTHASVTYKPRKMLSVKIRDASGMLQLRFLHFYPSQVKILTPGVTVRATGEIRHGFFGAEMVHPQCRVVKEDTSLAEALTPVYPTTQGLSQAALRKRARECAGHHHVARLVDLAEQAGVTFHRAVAGERHAGG